jgi:5'-3' exonuclease
MNQPAWLIDSSIYVFKAWYTNPSEQVDINGNPINAVLGFIDFVYRLLSYEKPQLIAFAFDESLQTSHRKEIYPDYKNNRSPAPDSLRKQFKLCRSFIQALGIHQDASLHYEADDLIGTWAQSLRHQNIAVNIITADKDLAQLVHENDHWWEYNRGNKLDSKAITKKFRVKPRQIADQLAIAGDKADNIPGVPRVGMATAAKLLKKFDNIDNLLSSIDDIAAMQIRGAKLIQESIYDHQDSIRLSRKLTGIECEIETVNTDVFRISTFDKGAFSQISTQLGLSQNTQKRWLTLINDLNK